MLLSELWDRSLSRHASVFICFPLPPCAQTFCMYPVVTLCFSCKHRPLLTLLHTHKDVDFCLRKARVPDPNSFICSFNVYMEKKKQLKTMKLQESTEGLTEYNEPLFSFFYD